MLRFQTAAVRDDEHFAIGYYALVWVQPTARKFSQPLAANRIVNPYLADVRQTRPSRVPCLVVGLMVCKSTLHGVIAAPAPKTRGRVRVGQTTCSLCCEAVKRSRRACARCLQAPRPQGKRPVALQQLWCASLLIHD